MELIYVYIEEYKNIKSQGFPISNKYNVEYENGEFKKIEDIENFSLFEKNIINTTAIVGRNNSGKTNLLDFIGKDWVNFTEGEGFLLFAEEENKFRLSILGQNLYEIIKKRFFIESDDAEAYMYEKNQYVIFFEKSKDQRFIKTFFKGVKNQSKIIYLKDDVNDLGRVRVEWMTRKESLKIKESTILNKYEALCYYLEKGVSFLDNNYFLNISFEIKPLIGNYGDIFKQVEKTTDRSKRISFHFINTEMKKIKVNLIETREGIVERKIGKENEELLSDFLKAGDTQESERILSEISNKNLKYSLEQIGWIDAFLLCDAFLQNEGDSKYLEILKKLNEDLEYGFILEQIERIDKGMQELGSNGTYSLQLEMNRNTKSDVNYTQVINLLKLIYPPEKEFIEKEDEYRVIEGFVKNNIEHPMGEGVERLLHIISSIKDGVNKLDMHGDDYTILIDEPEKGFHPELCRRFLSDFFANLYEAHSNIRFQFVLTTHSPFLITDLYANAVVFIEDGCVKKSGDVDKKNYTLAANIHELLADDFFMDSTKGELAKQKINEIIGWLKNENTDKDNTKIKEYDFVINQIADSFLQKNLKRKFEKKTIKYHHQENRVDEIVKSLNETEKNIILEKLQKGG